MDAFSGSACVTFGWETFKKRSWFFVGITLLIAVLSGILGAIGAIFGDYGVAQGFGILINVVLGTFIGMGATALFLKAHDSVLTVQSTELWHPQPFWYFLAAKLLIGVIVVLGLVLLVVPGVVFGLMFMFAPYLIIDKGLGPLEAMRESKRITFGYKWQLIGLSVALGLLNLLGALALLVGLLVTVPVTSLAVVHAYRALIGRASSRAVLTDA